MDISKVINDVVNQVSLQTETGMVDLNDAYHSHLVKEEMKKYLDEATVEQFFSSQEIISEAKEYDKWGNAELWDTLGKGAKQKAFLKFLKELPSGMPKQETIKVLKSLTEAEVVDFYKKLGSDSSINSHTVEKGLDAKIFHIDAKGIGKGEVYLAWKVKGAKIQGGNQSFDVALGSKNYEVKDYSGKKKSGAIRAGVEASVSKFEFWKQILKTVDVLQKMENEGAFDILLKSSEAFKPLMSPKDYLLNRVNKNVKIVTGEFNKEDQRQTQLFYDIAGPLLDLKDESANQVIFKGSNLTPVSYEIVPISKGDIVSGMKIEFSSSAGQITPATAINYLKTLKYVRTPSAFNADIQDAINKIITGGEADHWVIFRGTDAAPRLKVIDAAGTNFTYSVISQNGIKFKELEL